MHISSQLATAVPPSASRSAGSAPDNATGFQETLQAAAMISKMATAAGKAATATGKMAVATGKTTAANGRPAATANDKVAASADEKTAGETKAASEDTLVRISPVSLSGDAGGNALPLPTVANETPGPSLLAGNPGLTATSAPEALASALAETSVPAFGAQASSQAGGQMGAQAAGDHVVPKKGKPASSSADGSTGSVSAVLAAAAGTDSSAFPIVSTNPLVSGSGTQATVGADADVSVPVEVQVQTQGSGALGWPGATPPATAAGDPGLSIRVAVEASAGGPDARSASSADPVSPADSKLVAETISPVGSTFPSSVATAAQSIPTSLAAVASQQTAAPALPPGSTSAGGKDRSSAGEIRGKRKDAAANGSVLERVSTTATPSPFAAKLLQAQAPAQAGANDARSAEPATLQKVVDGGQPLPATTTPGSPQTTSAAIAAPATAAAPSASATPGDLSAESAVVPGASSAQLIQSAGQTEMRLGMRSAEFGNISISTSVSHQTISAQISLDHAELGRALAVHLPAIEEKLGAAYGLHARVEVRDESAASRSANDSGQQGGPYRDQTGGARGGGQSSSGAGISPVSQPLTGSAGSDSAAASLSSSGILAASARLDIRV